MPTYIIPDVHGCLKTLMNLFEEKLKVSKNDRLFMLGDYIDRGPDSAGVVSYLINLRETGYNITCLKGNHELLLLESLDNSMFYNLWMLNDGKTTLNSYARLFGSENPENEYSSIPNKHMEFFNSLPSHVFIDDKYILVHGGLDFRLDDPFSDEKSLLWKRPEELPDSFMPGMKVIHGHTPTQLSIIVDKLSTPDARLIGIDAGCVYKGKRAELGYLTALDLYNWKLFWVENID